jgi:peptidoglycan hydrolase CwlO-like protein
MTEHLLLIIALVVALFLVVAMIGSLAFQRKMKHDNKMLLEALDKRDKVIENFRTTQHKLQTTVADKDAEISDLKKAAELSRKALDEKQEINEGLRNEIEKLTPVKGANGKFVKKNSIDSRVAEAKATSPGRRKS